MASKIKQGFHMDLVKLRVTDIFPTKTISTQIRQGRKYRQVLSSIREVGLIEAPVVTPLEIEKNIYCWTDIYELPLLKNWGLKRSPA